MEKQVALEQEITNFLQTVNKANFFKKYDDLVSIILEYKDYFSRKEMLNIIMYLYNEKEWDENQGEVLSEIGNRLDGYASPNLRLNW